MVYRAGEYARLNENQVHLWLTFFDDPRLDALLDEYRRLLTADEREQEKRFYFEADRRRYLVTRALLRCTLSRYVNTPPSDWRFAANEYGRPHIADAQGLAARIHFNISHTHSLIAVAVSLQGTLGVDTENVARRPSVVHLADHYFADAEKAALQSLPFSLQPFRFFEYWTLKESYIKARGMGLSIPLDRFSFDVSRPNRIALSVDPSLEDDAARWTFWQWSLDKDYLLALCAQRSGEVHPSVHLWRTLPLLAMQPEDAAPSRTSHPRPAPTMLAP
jgi:4'-phosphopantetheinyl transferase